LWLKNGAVNTKAPSTVPGHKGLVNGLTVLVGAKTKMNNWMSCHSWGQNVPKTAQAIVLAMNGVPEKAMHKATVLTALVSTKAPTCEQLENKSTTSISKYITA
jgi:hypothetical protein